MRRSVFAVAGTVVSAAFMSCSLPVVPRAQEVAGLTGKSADGAGIYATDCSRCHSPDGKGGDRSDPKASHSTMLGAIHTFSAPETITLVIQGAGTMPAFDRYSDQQLADVYAYIMSLPH
jgi:mono/diheme cytochrome c family protein